MHCPSRKSELLESYLRSFSQGPGAPRPALGSVRKFHEGAEANKIVAIKEAPTAVVGLVLRERDAQLEFLLTLRSREIVAHAGQVCLPGGAVDADETVFQALDRELEEEVGLPIGSIEWAEPSWENLPSRYGLQVAPFVGFYKGLEAPFRISEAEVADAAWLPLADLFDEKKWDVRTLVRMAEPTEAQAPGGALDSPLWYGWRHVTWGLTAAFLAYFVRRISGRAPIGLQFRRKI